MEHNLGLCYKYYKSTTPTFNRARKLIHNNILGIDHIAFRSLDKMPKFISYYKLRDDIYKFPMYNVEAKWISHVPYYNRIFSSCHIGIRKDMSLLPYHDIIMCILKNKHHNILSYNLYEKIENINQYVAWTLIHDNLINHVALEVDDIEKVVVVLQNNGFELNRAGSTIINVSNDKKLLQCSLVSGKHMHNFSDGSYLVPGAFVEFVQRIDGRDGFEQNNAINISQSTSRKI